MRRRGFSWFVVLPLTGALGVTAALAANFAHRTNLDDWVLGRFVPPPEEARAAEAGAPPPMNAGLDAAAPGGWPDRYALRIYQVDVRGPWPLSALLQEQFERLADEPGRHVGLHPVFGIDHWPWDDTLRPFGGVAGQTKLPNKEVAFGLWSRPNVIGALARPTDCLASGIPGAEQCVGLEALDAHGMKAIYLEGPAGRTGRLAFGVRALVVIGSDPLDQRPFHRVRAEAWLPESELVNLPRGAREAVGMALLAAPDRDTNGDGVGDAYTFHLEAWGEPVHLLGDPWWGEIMWHTPVGYRHGPR
jgi:hypothetical protein